MLEIGQNSFLQKMKLYTLLSTGTYYRRYTRLTKNECVAVTVTYNGARRKKKYFPGKQTVIQNNDMDFTERKKILHTSMIIYLRKTRILRIHANVVLPHKNHKTSRKIKKLIDCIIYIV